MFIVGAYTVERDIARWAVFSAEHVGVSLHAKREEAVAAAVGYNGGDLKAPIYYTTFRCRHCSAEIHVWREPVGWAESPDHCGHPCLPYDSGVLNAPPPPKVWRQRTQLSLGIGDDA